MPHPTPPQVQNNLDQFREAMRAAEGVDIDPLTAPWEQIEKAVIKMLGGAFSPDDPAHTGVAVMIAAALAGRLSRDLGAFWFSHRATLEGAALGFPEAMMVVSPLEVALQALSRARLPLLDEVATDLRQALADAKLRGAGPQAAATLGPDDYRRLLDPGLVQFVCVDPARASLAREATPAAAARELEDAFKRLSPQVPAEMRQSMRQQFLGALKQLDGARPLGEQVNAAPQLLELLTLLHGGIEETAFAPAEFWQGVLLPLLHIGATETFPPLDEEELEAFRQGADPLLLYVESVPFRVPTPDEDGLLGVFPPEEISLVDECFEGISAPRLLRVPAQTLSTAQASFDGAQVRAAIQRFKVHLEEKAGGAPGTTAAEGAAGGAETDTAGGAGASSLLEVALRLLADLGRVMDAVSESKGVLCLRHATEAEAASHPLLREARRALQAPRIVLAR